MNVLTGGTQSESQLRAAEIMGNNYVGLDQAEECFGVEYTREQRSTLLDIPFTEEILRRCQGSHFLFPGYPLSIAEMRERKAHDFERQNWYKREDFARKVVVPTEWCLLRLGGRSYPQEKVGQGKNEGEFLGPDEELASASMAIFGTILRLKAAKKSLFGGWNFGRCRDLSSEGQHVCVGSYGSHGGLVELYPERIERTRFGDEPGLLVGSFWSGYFVRPLVLAAIQRRN